MESSSQESLSNQDNIEWLIISYTFPTFLAFPTFSLFPLFSTFPLSNFPFFSTLPFPQGGTSITFTPRSSNVNNHESKIPLRAITFNNKHTSVRMFSSGVGDMALLVRGKSREISICLNNMKDEIVINVKEIEEFRIAKDRDQKAIVLRLNPNFDRTYLYHSEGYPYKENPVRLYKDPTNDRLTDLSCLNLKPENFIKSGELFEIEKFIKKLVIETGQLNKASRNNNWTSHNFRSIKNDNAYYSKEEPSMMNSKGILQPNSTLKSPNVTTIQRREIYITCIIPTQKRAVIYPCDGLLGHFQFYLKQRFGWKWDRMWYNNKGFWTLLNDEEEWKRAKKRIQFRRLPRLEVFMR
ncbi:28746_t:CDS:2 [Dentiscutata erythropus]|uniref:28746_t:CDS:1 n=1 Tax=Dentiscutata erythropus TaxID=1348616 RepID=A0A9N8ZKS8_9GLOM|nr:28746_t:CDS:2 [Dentiscutata erythropus]